MTNIEYDAPVQFGAIFHFSHVFLYNIFLPVCQFQQSITKYIALLFSFTFNP